MQTTVTADGRSSQKTTKKLQNVRHAHNRQKRLTTGRRNLSIQCTLTADQKRLTTDRRSSQIQHMLTAD